jgi:hypothetical protein
LFRTFRLAGLANRVSVILPWGSLLQGIVLAETALVANLRRLCASDATIEIVFSYDERRDAGRFDRIGLVDINESHMRGILADSYERAGFLVSSINRISQPELQSYETNTSCATRQVDITGTLRNSSVPPRAPIRPFDTRLNLFSGRLCHIRRHNQGAQTGLAGISRGSLQQFAARPASTTP